MKGKTMGNTKPIQKGRKRVKFGIKLKLLGILLPIVIGVIVLIMVQVYSNTRKIVLEKSEAILTSNTQSILNEVGIWMTDTLTTLVMQRDTMEFYDLDEAQILEYVKHTANQYESFPAGIYVATTKGELIHASFQPGPEFNVFEKPWYQDGLESEEFIFGAIYFDEDSQSYVVGASGMLKDRSGKSKGVAAADIYLSAISDIVKDVRIEETGRMFLVDADSSMIIGHPEDAMIGQKLNESDHDFYTYIGGRINRKETGLGEFVGTDGTRTYVDIEEIPGSHWMTAAYVPQQEILAELQQLTSRIIFTAVIGCILIILLMERIIHIIVRPVRKLSSTIAAITEGDFTVDVPVRTLDEIGFMADGVRKFIETMRDTIRKIGQVSNTLNQQAEDSRKMSEELSLSAGNQAESMDEMTHTISELTRSVAEVAENATALAALVADVKEKSDTAGEQILEAVNASDSGKEDIGQVSSSMSFISKKMDSLEKCTVLMDGSIGKINAIVGLIGEIAEETNLLSLNASIEAARAGEAGRGFAVVAGQIAKLAATSKESVQQISTLTNEISTIVRQTVAETQESVAAIRDSSEMVAVTEQAFAKIYQSVNTTNEAVEAMTECIKGVNDIAVSVAGITEEQSAASEEILATAETVHANTEKVSSSSKQVESSAGNMDESAKLLGKEMYKFRV